VLRSTALIDAASRSVAGLLRDVGLSAAALGRDGHRIAAARPLLASGDEVALRVRLPLGVRVPLRMVVGTVSAQTLTATLLAGPPEQLRHVVTLTPTPAGTLVLDELSWTSPGGLLGRVLDVAVLRRLVLRAQAARLELLAERATALADAPVVVATALHRGGRVLIAQRTRPAELAGRWELPGGRVEPGESEPDAADRECREELGMPVRVGGRIGTDLPIAAGVLRVYLAEPAADAPDPQPLEHAALRWVGPDELDDVDWVDADRAVVEDLAGLLTGPHVQPRT
jgi:8-oxo-dGTP diphosphatase